LNGGRPVNSSHRIAPWLRLMTIDTPVGHSSALYAMTRTHSGVSDECRVLLRKPLRENDIGKNGPACQDRGLPNDPFPARRPH
jgi:hypothetical protein